MEAGSTSPSVKDSDDAYTDDSVSEAEVEGVVPAALARRDREQREETARNRASDELGIETKTQPTEEQEAYFQQTVGTVFVWTLENAVMALLNYCVFLAADAITAPAAGGTLIAQWNSLNILLATVLTAAICGLIAFVERTPGIFTRHYMMATQAYCSIISCVTTVFSAVAWKSSQTGSWRTIFLQSDSAYLHGVLVLVVVSNNVQWVLSLVLTYSCTRFGDSNSAFLQLPLAAAFVLFLVLVNETATNGLVLCQGSRATLGAYAITNAAIVTSFIAEIFSAVEFDPQQIFPPWMHSTLETRRRFDVYALLHGLCLLFATLAYGTMAKLSRSTFLGTVGVLAFTVLTTLIHTVDLRYIATRLLQSDDEDEQQIRVLEEEMAASFVRAQDELAPTRPAPAALPRRRRLRRAYPWRDEDAGVSPADAEQLRDLGTQFSVSNRRRAHPTAVSIFPNIPVSLRRAVY